jgi:hypothetical protein
MPPRYDGHRYIHCRWCGGRGCLACEGEAKKAYEAAFPNGPPAPIATIRIDTPEGLAKARALLNPDALRAHFGPGGEGMAGFEKAMRAASDVTPDTLETA